MIGVISLVIILLWIVIGKRLSPSTKVILCVAVVASYIWYLVKQGATPSEIVEILFPFYVFYR